MGVGCCCQGVTSSIQQEFEVLGAMVCDTKPIYFTTTHLGINSVYLPNVFLSKSTSYALHGSFNFMNVPYVQPKYVSKTNRDQRGRLYKEYF